MAIDYGPLIVFFVVNFLVPAAPMIRLVGATMGFLSDLDQMAAMVIARVICATAAFVLATVAAIIVSRVKLGRVSPMLWISGALVVVFGGLTIWLRDPRFIQIKPTIVYATFAGVLAFGVLTGRPLLGSLLGSAYPGLSKQGWHKLTRNWTLFFVGMALLNEAVRLYADATMSKEAAWSTWSLFKMPGCVILTFVFAMANVPMLLKHGLLIEDGAAAKELPPE
jgi:intracellular septation protein